MRESVRQIVERNPRDIEDNDYVRKAVQEFLEKQQNLQEEGKEDKKESQEQNGEDNKDNKDNQDNKDENNKQDNQNQQNNQNDKDNTNSVKKIENELQTQIPEEKNIFQKAIEGLLGSNLPDKTTIQKKVSGGGFYKKAEGNNETDSGSDNPDWVRTETRTKDYATLYRQTVKNFFLFCRFMPFLLIKVLSLVNYLRIRARSSLLS